MELSSSFYQVIIAAFSLAVITIGLEQLIQPRPLLRRPKFTWTLHLGLTWLVLIGFILLLARPWFATALTAAVFLVLVLVNNAKYKALREPFIFQDYEYFLDAIKHPRLYIPFFGWGKFFISTLGFVFAITVGFWVEPATQNQWQLNGQLGALLFLLVLSLAFLLIGNKKTRQVIFLPEYDLKNLGLLAKSWQYAQAEREQIKAPSAFVTPSIKKTKLPNLVAVQSESFFDPRSLYPAINPKIFAGFDQVKATAIQQGQLKVPAWGANTVRTEFAFLTGLAENNLGVHRFNPYRAVLAGQQVPSIAAHLKNLGYTTLAIHPYPASFYYRNKVFPLLGFDEFIDITHFSKEDNFGPYISDLAVAKKIEEVLDLAKKPVFVFVITMENHGPLHLEEITQKDVDNIYLKPPPEGCKDLTVYLRHINNASLMVKRIQEMLATSSYPASLCWYGDHVPIMPQVYKAFGLPEGMTEFVLWTNQANQLLLNKDLKVTELASTWLELNNLM